MKKNSLFILMLIFVSSFACAQEDTTIYNAINSQTCPGAGISIETKAIPDSMAVDSIPEFVGGKMAMGQFLAKNVRYPQEAKEKGQMGVVWVQFVVEKDGSITQIEILKEVEGAPSLSEETLRVVKRMPKMKPAMKDGKIVRARTAVPVKFILN